MRTGRLLLVGLLLATLVGCDPTSPGRDLYEEGRYAESLAAFDEAVAAAGDEASAHLLYDQALAAVRVGQYREAEAAARRALDAPGGDELVPLCDFVLGNAAYLRSLAAEAEANRPGGEPTAHEWAIASAVDALAAWRRAATSRDDWPEARRNVERALLRIERLREQKAGGTRRIDIPVDRPPEAPAPRPDPPAEEPDERPAMETADLSSEEVAGLFELLRTKEREKVEGRRADRAKRGGGVEKDW